jgi:hypothetical protein
MQITRRFQVLVPRYECTSKECPFTRSGRLDALVGEVAGHVRDTGHFVRLTESSAVIYGPAVAELAGAR